MNPESRENTHASDEQLSALLDGDLAAEETARIAKHLESCSECAGVRDELCEMRTGLLGLADAAPRRDLWPSIAEGHRRENRSGLKSWLKRFWLLPAASAAGAAAALLVVWMMGTPGASGPTAEPTGPVKARTAVLEAEQTYSSAVGVLQKALGEQKPGYSGEAKIAIEQGLADIDQTIARCRLALRANPEDLAAHETMLAAYQHKVDFMTELLGEQL